MAREFTDQNSSVAISTPTQASWWDLCHNHNHHRHSNSVSSWINTNDSATTWHQHQRYPNSNNSSCDEDISMSTSFTYVSNHSGLTVESSRRLVEADSSSNDFTGEHAPDNQLWSHLLIGIGSNGDLHSGENSLDAPSTKNLSSAIFEPACDFLKKPSSSWEFTNFLPHLNNYEKHMNVFNDSLMENEKVENIEDNGAYFRRSFNGDTIGYNLGLNSSFVGDNKYYSLRSDVPCGTKNSRDFINFNSRFNKQLIDVRAPKPGLKSLNSSDGRKLTSSLTAGRGNEGKKKRLVETSDTNLKKPKHESSTASSIKAPKVKLGDKITALQQIVSPFGKTDTASVLYEAIQYIKFLHEQVQLLSNPYMKTNSHKDPWGSLERKDKGEAKLDLRNRGLCLVPISCTPQFYHQNTGTDYWTPTYRGCIYR